MQRFWAVKKELHTFLKGQNSVKAKLFLDFLEDVVEMKTTGFLTDVMLHLNDLNVKLQGKNHSVFDLSQQFVNFEKNWNCLLLMFGVNFSTFPNFWSSVEAIFI